MTFTRLIGAVLACALWAGAAHAQDRPAVMAASAIDGDAGIVLDGELGDAAWQRATPVNAFVQREPLEGGSPTFRTEARVIYDASAIYVGVQAFDDEPARIAAFLTRRDAESASDWLQVYIDSYHDKRTAYQFGVNPLGVKQDVYWFNDDSNDDSWDAVWDVVVRRTADGWQAEYRIPFSQLRFSGAGDGQLGFAITREVARLNETSTWPLLSKSATGWVSSFGTLTGVSVGGASKRLELVPYSVAQVLTAPRDSGNPLQKTPDPGLALGADLKYAVTSGLTLTATVNPDFGQVEADPAVVNLSAFETFFDEKRPFFVEGSGTYQFECRDCNIFYSRRIGRAPRGTPTIDEGGYSAAPTTSTILGAAKLTGRLRNFSVGVLTAATDAEEASAAFGDLRWTEVVEPRTFYSVSRVRREFSDQSSIGFILTTTSRQLAESVSFLPDSAVTGGIDYDWRIGKLWGLNGYWSGSRVAGSTEAIDRLQQNNVHSFQRPDAEHVELNPLATSLRGHSGNIDFAKIAGERLRGNVTVGYRSPGFEVNDIGFQRRADEIPQNAWVQIRWNAPGKYKRNGNINFNQWSRHNFDGDRLAFGGNVNSHWEWQNFWNGGGGIDVNARRFDDRLTRGGPGGYTRPSVTGWQYFNTNERRLVRLRWDSNFYADGRSHNFTLEPRIVLKPTASLDIELGQRYEKRLEDAQWVEAVTAEGRTHYVFGHMDQTTSAMTTRVNYTVTPNLSIQVYAQPFVSSGRFEHFKELVNGRATRYDDRYATFVYDGTPDFKVLSFRTTNVMRWEYKPGSTLFVVWQQGREGIGTPGSFRYGRDMGDVFATPSSNALLVKLAYWLNP
jgi:hypothetical protein